MTPFFLGVFAVSLFASFSLTKFVRDFATVRGWVAAPGSGRHLHSRPLPRLGGVAIFLAFLASVFVSLVAGKLYPGWQVGFSAKAGLMILAPGTLVFLLGVYDDLRSLGPPIKFAVQAIAAVMLFAGGLRINNLPVLFGTHQFSWFISLALTTLWVLAVTNAFNLIDGLDGLAAGSALFSTLVVFVVALLGHSTLMTLMTLALAGAILGFLRFNFNPATIFLGDCGSLFIGFLLSALALQGAAKAPTTVAIAIPVVSFGLPILETVLSIARRFISGRPVFTADREHIHHKLLQLGLSHRQVVIVLYGASGIFALLSLFLLWPAGSTLGLVLAVLGTGIWVGVQHLGYLEFGELRRVAQRTIEQRQIVINNLALRRAVQELKVAQTSGQLASILIAAFSGNDFDALDLRFDTAPLEFSSECGLHLMCGENQTFVRWERSASHFHGMTTSWSLNLDLVSSNDRRVGAVTLHRVYSTKELQFDVNLLILVFPVALADALLRVSAGQMQPLPNLQAVPSAMAAGAD